MRGRIKIEATAVDKSATLDMLEQTIGGHRLEYSVDLTVENIKHLSDMIFFFFEGKLPLNLNFSSTVEVLGDDVVTEINKITEKLKHIDLEGDHLNSDHISTLYKNEGGLCKDKVC